jgi:hypothetical protein
MLWRAPARRFHVLAIPDFRLLLADRLLAPMSMGFSLVGVSFAVLNVTGSTADLSYVLSGHPERTGRSAASDSAAPPGRRAPSGASSRAGLISSIAASSSSACPTYRVTSSWSRSSAACG